MLAIFLILLLLELGSCTTVGTTLTNINLYNHVTLLEQKVAALETKDHDRELAMTSLKSQVASSNNRIQHLESKLSTAEAEIAILKYTTGSISKTSTDVASLKKDVSRLQFNVSTSGVGSNANAAILTQISGLKQNISTLQAAQVNTPGRATFVRWGRTDCPNGNDIIYKGYAGGKHYQESGTGTNYLCLPDSPIYGPHHSETYSRIYGVEYYAVPTSTVKTYDDVPCVVCQSQTRSNSLMVPARNQCFSGWNLEFTGFIMAGHYLEQSTEYICVDQDPQAIAGRQVRAAQGFLVPISSMCGALECPPYSDGVVIPCALCTN